MPNAAVTSSKSSMKRGILNQVVQLDAGFAVHNTQPAKAMLHRKAFMTPPNNDSATKTYKV
jgi:hypothetical protein